MERARPRPILSPSIRDVPTCTVDGVRLLCQRRLIQMVKDLLYVHDHVRVLVDVANLPLLLALIAVSTSCSETAVLAVNESVIDEQ